MPPGFSRAVHPASLPRQGSVSKQKTFQDLAAGSVGLTPSVFGECKCDSHAVKAPKITANTPGFEIR